MVARNATRTIFIRSSTIVAFSRNWACGALTATGTDMQGLSAIDKPFRQELLGRCTWMARLAKENIVVRCVTVPASARGDERTRPGKAVQCPSTRAKPSRGSRSAQVPNLSGPHPSHAGHLSPQALPGRVSASIRGVCEHYTDRRMRCRSVLAQQFYPSRQVGPHTACPRALRPHPSARPPPSRR